MWRGTAISICRTAMRSTTGMPSGELPADCFITTHHASPFLRVRANCWDNFLCYFVSNPMPQFLQFPPTFPQSLARGFTSSILKKSVFVLSMTFLIVRSEEHTSELQSHSDLVCRLLLEKKKQR